MIILEDTRNKPGKHDLKNVWFEENGIEVRRTKLYTGDYTLPANQSICIDTKENIQELVMDICGKQHERFRRECEKAKEAGIELIILVENRGQEIYHTGIWNPTITDLSELHKWKNPRLFLRKGGKQLYPTATKGITLQKACYTMQKKYGVKFLFCKPQESGKKIIELLTQP